ncbi:MAG: cofactor-independent phosphoglycerate mutase [Deltaproteobacteria bacterium]|nr:cofactor-independent phosphoglycerate mutase [Deltaproteobacteria bacterium]
MSRHKTVILVGDGMGDYPLEELSGRTPLQAAHTPNMDAIARRGRLGLVRTIPQGMEAGSDVANLSIMGYDPRKYHTGRAPLEAASMGIELAPDEVAFRCNLVTLDFRQGAVYMEDYSAGHIESASARPLIEALDKELGNGELAFYPGVSYRHLMVWKGGPENAPSFPPHDLLGQEVSTLLTDERMPVLNELIRRSWGIIESTPRTGNGLKANSIWLWGSGKAPNMPGLFERFGIRGGVISAVDLLKGIGVYAGMESIEVPGATGYLDTNYEGKAQYALDRLKDLDLVYLHVEAPDEAAHSGSIENKIRAIEDFDRRVVGPVIKGLRQFGRYRVLLITDHNTPISVRTHTSEPVPFAVLDSSDLLEENPDRSFDETAAARTGDVVEAAHELMGQVARP